MPVTGHGSLLYWWGGNRLSIIRPENRDYPLNMLLFARTGPVLALCWQHRSRTGPVLACLQDRQYPANFGCRCLPNINDVIMDGAHFLGHGHVDVWIIRSKVPPSSPLCPSNRQCVQSPFYPSMNWRTQWRIRIGRLTDKAEKTEEASFVWSVRQHGRALIHAKC